MAEILTMPQFEIIPGTVYERLINNVRFYSDVLKRREEIKAGFICDKESTPWRGENPLGGLIHDWVSRKGVLDSKLLAARVYLEFMEYEDSLVKRKWYTKAWDWAWRYLKSGFVAVCPDFVYWHKHSVNATYEEMAGL